MRDIGKNIRDARGNRGLSQDALAERLHVTRQTVSNYETGHTRPDVEMLEQIAAALETDLSCLLYGPPAPPQRKKELGQRGRFLIGLAVCVVLLAAVLLLTPVVNRLQRLSYEITPRFILQMLGVTLLWFSAGWTLLQGIGLFLGAKPIRGVTALWVGRLLRIVVAVYFALAVVCSAGLAVAAFSRNGLAVNAVLSAPVQEILWALGGWLALATFKVPWIFALLGGGVWITCPGKTNALHKDPPRGAQTQGGPGSGA